MIHWMQGIGLSLTFSSLFFLIITQFKRKKRYDIWSKMKYGEICYRCKTDIGIEDGDRLIRLLRNETKMTLCESCKRDENLDTILDKKRFHIEFYDSNKMRKITGILSLISIILNVSAMWYRPLGFFGGLFIFTSQWIIYKNFMATSIKREY